MKNILILAGSNSKTSINKQLAQYIGSQLPEVNLHMQDWGKLELPLYSPHYEEKYGMPEQVISFKKVIDQNDGIVLSLAEHNSMPTAAFKNLWDWVSRIDKKIWCDKPIFLAATSPGGRGAISALDIIQNLMPHYGGRVIETFSLPRFYDSFGPEGIKDDQLAIELDEKIKSFSTSY